MPEGNRFSLTVQTEQLPSADIGFFIHIVAADNINQILTICAAFSASANSAAESTSLSTDTPLFLLVMVTISAASLIFSLLSNSLTSNAISSAAISGIYNFSDSERVSPLSGRYFHLSALIKAFVFVVHDCVTPRSGSLGRHKNRH